MTLSLRLLLLLLLLPLLLMHLLLFLLLLLDKNKQQQLLQCRLLLQVDCWGSLALWKPQTVAKLRL